MFAGTGWTLVRAQATMGEGAGKIREGIGFFTRGVRLLGSDVSSAGRLFYRAGAGASLRPREGRLDKPQMRPRVERSADPLPCCTLALHLCTPSRRRSLHLRRLDA